MTNIKISGLFTNAILSYYENKKSITKPLFELLSPYLNTKEVPLEIYNEACHWIENKLGITSLKLIGLEIGTSIYQLMLNKKIIDNTSLPDEVIEGFVKFDEVLIKYANKESWEIIEIGNKHLVVKLHQDFNRNIQLGILRGLIEKLVPFASIKFDNNTTDEYLLTWFTH